MATMKIKEAGFTLVELLATITILGIIIAIAVPAIAQVIEQSERESCDISVNEVGQHYHHFLLLEGLDHTDTLFEFFLSEHIDYNPNDHMFIYEEGHVRCIIHQPTNTGEEETDPVPWL
jgi:prepilin-type N-terminal cleavage/methylation domain-containing protein